MHYHLEVIMPPTDDIKGTLAQILEPFSEHQDETDEDLEYMKRYAFWDWYEIGGRWAGDKMMAALDKDKLAAFNAALQEKKITISGLIWGKEELSPASQIPLVDSLWNEFFPDSPTKVCPIFKHYQGSNGDVMELKDIAKRATAARVIIAGLDYQQKMTAQFMIEDSIYNGVNFVDSKWDGTIAQALEMFAKKNEHCKEEWFESHTPRPDWLVVTVDYHS